MASLLSFFKKVEQQINPFDHGATYSHPAAPPQRPQLQQTRYAPPQQGGLSVQPVQQAPIRPAFHVIPTANLQVHVAPPQPLQVGNQTIQPSPTVRTQTPARNAFLQQQLHPSLAQQVRAGLQQKLTVPLATAQTIRQEFLPSPQEIRQTYQSSMQGKHPGLAPLAAGAQASAYLPEVGLAAKGLTKGFKALDSLAIENAARNPAGQIGAVGKNVNKAAGLSKAELSGMAKQNFTPDLINKAHLQAGGKLDTNGVPIASDAKAPKVPGISSQPTYFSKSQNKEIPVSSMSKQHATRALGQLPKNADQSLVEALAKQSKIPSKVKTPLIPQTSKEGRITKISSLENRANRVGISGRGALQTMRNAEIGEKQHFQNFVDTTKPFYRLTPEEQSIAIKVQKGEGTTKSKAIQAGADSLKNMFRSAHQAVTATGKKVGDLGENYFPVHFPPGWFDKPENFNRAVQQMVATGKAKDLEDAVSKMQKFRVEGSLKPTEFGHFKTRETDLPGGQENADVVTQYMRGASKAIAQAEHFGPKNKVLNAHVATAVKNGEDAGALRNIISSYLHPARPKPGAVTTSLNAYQKGLRVIQLPRAAVSHLPQGFANTASDVGYTKYFKAIGNKIFKDPETEKLVAKSGLHTEDFGRHTNISDRATAPGLAPVMRFHRDVAFRGGVSVAKGLAKNGDVQGLNKIGVDGKFVHNADGSIELTDTQLTKAGHFEANKSIGSHSTLESPAWTQTNAGKAVGMYRKLYTFKQAERIANMFRDARAGNPAPLIRYLAVGAPLAGAGVAVAKDEIKDPGSNPLADVGKFAGDIFHDSGIGSVGYGLVDSGLNAAMHNYGNDSRWSNLAGAISPGAGFTVQTGQNIAKARHGNVKPLEREGFRMSPVGGTYLANKFAPSDIPKPGAAPTTPSQKEYVSKQEKKGLEKNIGKYGLSQLANGQYAYTLEGSNKIQTSKNLQDARNAIAESTLAKSGDSYKIVGQTVYRKDSTGKVTPQPKIKFDYEVGTATLTAQKNAEDLDGYVKTAQSQLDLIQKQLKDPSTDPLEALKLQNQATALQNNIDKYTGYGGFTKPKSGGSRVAGGGRGGKGAKFTIPKIAGAKAIKTPKGVKVKSPGSFKAPKTRKLSVSKIPRIKVG